MPIPDLQLHRPRSLEEARDLLARFRESARVLAGGTDLLVDLRQDRVTGVEHLVALREIPGLRAIEELPDGWRFGALVTPEMVARHPRVRETFPALAEAAACMAGWQVRNLGTIGGNIASAVPSSDLAPFFIAAGGEAILTERRVPLKDFFLGPRRTACARDEILTHLFVPAPAPRTGISYQRFALRGANALAVASVAAMLRLDGAIEDARVVLGAVAPIPLIAAKTSAFLIGKPTSVFAEAAKIAREEARPISDVRGSKEYRLEIVEVLAARALAQAAERCG
ncbi:MAG: FAD binding domain-containing protein [Planctomycetes bacterium]|nr:FAD binding domain-containing protein [Planctomycetota bacterium]